MPLAIKKALAQSYPKSYLEEPRDDVQVKSNNNPDGYEYCWKNSYGRGVGVVPPNCGPNQEKIGLFCYETCKSVGDRYSKKYKQMHGIKFHYLIYKILNG